MSNLVPVNVQVPTHLMKHVGKPSALAQSLSSGLGGDAPSYPRISIKGARFRIVEGDSETVLDQTSLDVVIVGANPRLSKTFYAKAWNPDAEPTGPDCYSLDGVSPHPDSTEPQNDLCASCPQNAWGSKVTPQGQQIKACADQKRLAVVAAEDPTGPVYLLQVTPAALKGLNQYHKELSVRGIPPEIVKTKVSFDTNASFPKLKFTFGGFIDEDTQNAVDKLFGTEQVLEITGEAAPKVAEVPPARPAPVKPKPVEEEPVAEAPAPAPAPEEAATPKRGFGSKSAAPKAAPEPNAEAPKAKPKAAVSEDASSLADEIADLLGEVDADD